MMPPEGDPEVAGVLLAGGRATRMGGGDKCLRPVAGRPLLAHVIERAELQVSTLVLNANGDPRRFRRFGLPVIEDPLAGFAGPLAGILAGMIWARDNTTGVAWIASFATDTPFLPLDLVANLKQAVIAEAGEIACAVSGGRAHPVFALWPVRLADDLRRALEDEGVRKIDQWTARYRLVTVAFPDTPVDPFFNVNAPEDLAAAAHLVR